MQFDAQVIVAKTFPTAGDTPYKMRLTTIDQAMRNKLLSLRRCLQAKRFLVQLVAASIIGVTVTVTPPSSPNEEKLEYLALGVTFMSAEDDDGERFTVIIE